MILNAGNNPQLLIYEFAETAIKVVLSWIGDISNEEWYIIGNEEFSPDKHIVLVEKCSHCGEDIFVLYERASNVYEEDIIENRPEELMVGVEYNHIHHNQKFEADNIMQSL